MGSGRVGTWKRGTRKFKKGEGLEKNWGLQALVGFCAFRFFCCFSQKFISLRFYFFIPDFLNFYETLSQLLWVLLSWRRWYRSSTQVFEIFFSRFSTFDVFLDVSFFSKIFFKLLNKVFFFFSFVDNENASFFNKRRRVTKVTQAVASWSGVGDIYRGDRGAVVAVV